MTPEQEHQARGSLTEAPLQSAPPRTDPSPSELIAIYGGAENMSRHARDAGSPVHGIRVVTQAELDEHRARVQARNIPGVPYREPPDHAVPPRITKVRITSEWVRDSLDDGFTWA